MIVVSNPRGDQPIAVPAHNDGTPYRFEMIFDGASKRVYADTWSELVAALITDYNDDTPNEHADEERLLYAVRTQVELQAQILADADTAAHVALTGHETQILLGDRDTPPRVGLWRCEIPVVLVTSFYQPDGELDRPLGRPPTGDADTNLIWLDPTDEQTLILSLAAAGVVSLAETDA